MRVAIVDSSVIVLKLLKDALVAKGFAVDVFTDSIKALEYIKSDDSIGILISGLELEKMHGMELIWNVRSFSNQSRPIFIIAMSSNKDKKSLAEALDSGADDFFAKPVDNIELFARVRSAQRVLAMQKHLLHLATRDALTGLLNRGAFLTKAKNILANMDNYPISLTIMDIDHFKKINDQYGHIVGDLALKSVAALLEKKHDCVGRIGGEEFAILLENKNEAQAKIEMEAVRHSIENLVIAADSYKLKCTGSFGIASVADKEKTIESAYSRADQALYYSKNNGRNLVSVY